MVVPPGGKAGLGRGTNNPSGDIGEFHPLQEPHRELRLKRKQSGWMHEQLQLEMQIRSHINQLAGTGISALGRTYHGPFVNGQLTISMAWTRTKFADRPRLR